MKAEAPAGGHTGWKDLSGEAGAGGWAGERWCEVNEGRLPSFAVGMAKKLQQRTSGSQFLGGKRVGGLGGGKGQRFF